LSRRRIIAGNWKMNMRRSSATDLASGVAEAVGESPAVDVVLCPPAVYLAAVGDAVAGTPVGLGAQNLYAASDGAFTGEVNADMLTDVGCGYVILGHSERRALLGETDEMISEKLHSALAGNLTPIVCVGETLEDRESGRTEEVVEAQVDVRDVDDLLKKRVGDRPRERVLPQLEQRDAAKGAVVAVSRRVARVDAADAPPLGVPRARVLVDARRPKRHRLLGRIVRPSGRDRVVHLAAL